jgi:hypothetical protein
MLRHSDGGFGDVDSISAWKLPYFSAYSPFSSSNVRVNTTLGSVSFGPALSGIGTRLCDRISGRGMIAPDRFATRTFVPSSRKATPIRVGLSVSGHITCTRDTGTGASVQTIFLRVESGCGTNFFTIPTPSTITLLFARTTSRTRPRFPRCGPDVTCTKSPRRIRHLRTGFIAGFGVRTLSRIDSLRYRISVDILPP